jgi:hypothetical protein
LILPSGISDAALRLLLSKEIDEENILKVLTETEISGAVLWNGMEVEPGIGDFFSLNLKKPMRV